MQLLSLLVLLATQPSAPLTETDTQITPGVPQAFHISPLGPGFATFEVDVPKDATAMHIWTSGATDDVSLVVEGISEDWGAVTLQGPDVWLDEDLRFSVADTEPLFAGTWTIQVSLGAGSLGDGLPLPVKGQLHVELLEPLRGTLVPGEVFAAELTLDHGYRAVFDLPADFAPERRSEWRVEAFSPSRDIDLVVGPRELPQTLDYPYGESQRAINYERCTFEGRQAPNLATHVFSYLDSEESEPIPIRVRLTEVREAERPPSLLPPPQLPRSTGEGSPSLATSLASTVAIFGPLGSGSGTVISSSGLILTNAHVALAVSGSASPRAKQSRLIDAPPTYFAGFQHDPRRPVVPEVALELLDSREDLDLALLRIVSTLDGHPVGDLNLPAIELADPATLELGAPLWALGYPGTGGAGALVTVTLTRGICSGFSREEGQLMIKTDAGVHSGVSGGALLDANWRLVGIPASSISDSNLAGGIGFAIPTSAIPGPWRERANL